MPTLTLRPNAPGTYQDWDLVDTTHEGATSDQNDNTFVEGLFVNDKETENLADTSITGTINSVTAYMRAIASGGGNEQAVILWRTYGTDYESAAKTISTIAFTNHSETRTVNPNTGAAWTWAEVNALQVGAKITQVSVNEYIDASEFWIEVDYTEPSGRILRLRVLPIP